MRTFYSHQNMTDERYSKEDVAAVVITYNGDNVPKVLDVLLEQVAHIIIVDNGSESQAYNDIKNYEKNEFLTVIRNTENRGQAEALNQGWKKADELGYRLVLTMDQDSTLNWDCVSKLLKGLEAGFDSVGPNYEKKRIKNDYKKVRYLITSGNLLTIKALKKIGGYDSRLFIDSVDFDVSLRLRKAGYRLAVVRDAKMNHCIGEQTVHDNGFIVFEHSTTRHYYIARNHHYIIRRYFSFDPVFCAKKQISYIKSLSDVRKEQEPKKKIEARKRGRKDACFLLRKNEF